MKQIFEIQVGDLTFWVSADSEADALLTISDSEESAIPLLSAENVSKPTFQQMISTMLPNPDTGMNEALIILRHKFTTKPQSEIIGSVKRQ